MILAAVPGGAEVFGAVPYVVLSVYLLVLLLLGWIGFRRSRTGEEDYYLAGRSQGWIVSSLSIMATFFSSFALLGAPGMVYREGVVFALFSLNVAFAGISIYVLGARIWRIGRAKGYVTPADMVADYYGSRIALPLLVTLAGILYSIPYIMMQIQAGGQISTVMFADVDRSFEVGAITLAAITMFYVMIGGMRSVAWSDVLQGFLLMGGMFVGGIAMVAALGGPAEFGERVSQLPARALTLPGTTGAWPWPMLFTVVVFASLGAMVQPAQWMRFYSARGPATLRRSAMTFGLVLPPCFLLGVMLVGLGGQVLYPLVVDAAGNVQPHADVQAFDRILIVFLSDQLPAMLGNGGVVLASLVIVAVMAASMSTADSSLHALSALCVRDVYDRFVRPRAGERERVWVGRGVIVVATALALAFVVLGEGQNRAMREGVDAAGQSARVYEFMQMIAVMGLMAIAFSAQLLPIAIDILYVRKGTAVGAVAGLAAGLLAALVFGQLFVPVVEGIEGPIAGFRDLAANEQPWLVQTAFFAERCRSIVPIHAAAWGLLFNVPVFVAVSLVTPTVPANRRAEFAALLQ